MSFSCFLIGGDTLLMECGDILLKRGHTVRGVVTASSRIRDWAQQRSLNTIALDDAYPEALKGESFDYLFAITHLSLIPDQVLALPTRAAINFHDGPLPRYAGLNTPAWALMNREASYGITWHEMTSGVDEGRILKQVLFDLSPNETSLTLNTRNFEEAMGSFGELVDELDSGTSQPRAQEGTRSYFGRHQRPARAGFLDWSKPASELEALVRALDFGPYDNPLTTPKVWLGSSALSVLQADAVDDDDSADAGLERAELAQGQVSMEGDQVWIGCAEGSLRLVKATTLSGEPVEQIASLLQPKAGLALPPLPDALATAISEHGEQLARSEPLWERRLSSVQPAELALASTASSPEAAFSKANLVPWPAELKQAFGERATTAALAAVGLYVGRTSNKLDFLVGLTAAAQRNLSSKLTGLVAPAVPLRFRWDPTESFQALVEAVDKELELLDKRGTYYCDFAARKPALSSRRALALGGIAPVWISMLDGNGLDVGAVPPDTLLAIGIGKDGLEISTRDGAFENPRALEEQLLSAVRGALEDSNAPCGRISLLSEAERQRVLVDWNQTERSIESACIHELFEARAKASPERDAVVFGAVRLTYAELDARANAVAAALRAKGVGPDELVGVMVDRSEQLLVATLGVMKAGGAYLPLDPAYPSERLAFMVQDSGAKLVLTHSSLADQTSGVETLFIDAMGASAERPEPLAKPSNLAYVIYTSGSTGKPKGVMVEHRNVANFFGAMDEVIAHEDGSVWLSVTSLSFDISVLELFWTLARGFTVVLYRSEFDESEPAPMPTRSMDFSLFMWGADDRQSDDKYDLMLHAGRFGDEHGFAGIWTPERHFHAFGGPYPNPAVTSAALASITSKIQIRGGSCVIPLHHPVRVAEEWAVVDNISHGRVGIAFASGWQPNDFLLRPESFRDAKQVLIDSLETVRRLWRGEAVTFDTPLGKPVDVVSQPRPVQKELPFWITTAGNPDTFRIAGRQGANLLTHLLGQTVEELAEKVRAYREARAEAGFAPETGIVSLMLHTYVGEDDETVRQRVREPMKTYLKSSVRLIQGFAWAFPAFKKPKKGGGEEIDVQSLSEEDLDTVLEFAFERYYETSGLFGTPTQCLEMIARVQAIDVDEVACLIDFGVPIAEVKEGLVHLASLKQQLDALGKPTSSQEEAPQTLGALARRHGATHFQCTPSQLQMTLMDPDNRAGVLGIEHIMIGGEAFPLDLVRQVSNRERGTLTNMYGPTETTIWSTTHRFEADPTDTLIGKPIANTRVYVLDEQMMPVPTGVPGELFIGGAGVVRGYHGRPELTRERFVEDPFSKGNRLYRTGDRVRWRSDGTLEFIGRTDQQIKLRGHRIELGEIEARLRMHEGVDEAVVVMREDTPGDQRLVAYFTGRAAAEDLRKAAQASLPDFMVPSPIVSLPQLPRTPNGKIDRKALPIPEQQSKSTEPKVAPESETEQTVAELWQDVLGLDSVGVNDNFFELGGHSLLVVRLHQLLKTKVREDLPMTAVYRFPTIRTFVQSLSGGSSETAAQARDRGRARRHNIAARRREARRPR